MMTFKRTALVFLAVVLLASDVKAFCQAGDDCDQVSCDQSLDIAIVGAGPGGAYSAYQLRDSGKDIGVFEYSDRVGGRLFTYSLPNTPDQLLEIGGMRMIDGSHVRLQSVVAELGLTSVVFTEQFGVAGRLRYFFRNQSLSVDEVKGGDVPYQLTPEEKANQGHLLEFYLEKLTGLKLNGGALTRDTQLRLKVADGRMLYQLTFDEAFDMVASSEGKAFIKATHVFGTEVTGRASALMIFDDHLGEDGSAGQVLTVQEGMSSVPNTLLNRFKDSSASNQVTMDRHLLAIRRKSNDQYVLYFEHTTTTDRVTVPDVLSGPVVVCARKVILAIPHFALSRLDWPQLKQQRYVNAMRAVRPTYASKVFMTFDTPWWLTNNNPSFVTKTDGAFSQMYDWSQSQATGAYTMIASYADADKTRHLKSLYENGPLIPGSEPGYGRVTVALKEQVLHSLADAYGISRSDIPEPLTATSQFWTNYPFGCGWTTWRAGFHIDDTIETLRRPSLTDDVFVQGADYSWGLMTAWVEGAFETSEDVISKYF